MTPIIMLSIFSWLINTYYMQWLWWNHALFNIDTEQIKSVQKIVRPQTLWICRISITWHKKPNMTIDMSCEIYRKSNINKCWQFKWQLKVNNIRRKITWREKTSLWCNFN